MDSSSFSLKTRYWCPKCFALHLPQQGTVCLSCNVAMTAVELIANRYVFHPKNRLGRSVIKVWDQRMGRWTAIKFPRGKKEYQTKGSSTSTSRIEREIFIHAQLEHPAIVPAYDVVEDPDYGKGLVMGLVVGLSLYQLVSRHGAIRPRAAVEIIRDITGAVQYMHSKGIIHRDLTPGNIILEGKKAVLIDFGLAKFLSDVGGDKGYLKARTIQGKDYKVTQEGEILGTPLFMAPEQVEGSASRVDQRSDIYGLGATLYYITTGKPPFSGKDVLSVISQVLHKNPVPPSQVNPKIDKPLEAIILKAMHKKQEKRFQTAEEFYNVLQSWLDGEELPQEVYRRPLAERLARKLGRWRRPVLFGLFFLSLVFAALSYGYALYVKRQAYFLEIPNLPPKFWEEAEKKISLDLVENLSKEGKYELALSLLNWMKKNWEKSESFQKIYYEKLKKKEKLWKIEAAREKSLNLAKKLLELGDSTPWRDTLFLLQKALDLLSSAHTQRERDEKVFAKLYQKIIKRANELERQAPSKSMLIFYLRFQEHLEELFSSKRSQKIEEILHKIRRKIQRLKEREE